jgi:sulfhydrogenase subunit beta (sulfur reductase)
MSPEKKTLERGQFHLLIDALKDRGFQVRGPKEQDGVLDFGEIQSLEDLPQGLTEVEDNGSYRLKKTNSPLLFNCHVGPHSLKDHLFRPVRELFSAERRDGDFKILPQKSEAPKTAFLGVRACDLAAVAIQDRIFLHDMSKNPDYQAWRQNLFVVAVNCASGGNTCFCASMKTGPRATQGFDLALTEILNEGRHYFLVETGSKTGGELLDTLPCRKAKKEELAAAHAVEMLAQGKMGRSLETHGLKELLARQAEHSHWEEIAGRCLTCTNCTLVCPTCFCSTVEDLTDLKGETATRRRRWDSCFTLDFTYIHGGSVRVSPKSRFRQWMIHKLSTWIDQFGMSGCVGCGRCITWCPVGIDLTAESRAFRELEKAAEAQRAPRRVG